MSCNNSKKHIHGYITKFDSQNFEGILIDKEGVLGEQNAEYDIILPISCIAKKYRKDISENIVFKWEFSLQDHTDSRVDFLRWTKEDVNKIKKEANKIFAASLKQDIDDMPISPMSSK